MNTLRRPLLAALAGLSIIGLAACSRSEPEAEVVRNLDDAEVATEAPAPLPPVVEPAPPVAQAGTDANAADATPPDAPTPPDEQMLDDASATGMTARAARGEEAEEQATTDAEGQ